MLRNKDILELKRRFKKEACTFTRLCGCYVDSNREKVVKLNETFLNLEDEEFYKYLEIAKKSLSGTIGNNLLDLKFNKEEEESGGKQQYLLGLRESALKNPDLLEHLYDMIIEHYDYVGNYLILIFHDAYDVITKTNDDLKLDESEEVYQYLLCAICPVNLSKPGLGYREDENRIGPRIQDWVVGAPDVGFLFPSFIERSADVHTLTYYVRDAKDSHADFVETALGCGSKRTATEEQHTFHSLVKKTLAPVMEEPDNILLEIQESLNTLVEEKEAEMEDLVLGEPEEIILTSEIVKEVLTKAEIPDAIVNQLEEDFQEEFQDTPPVVKHLVDEKAIERNLKAKKELQLLEEVASLKEELKSHDIAAKEAIAPEELLEEDMTETIANSSEVFLRVAPEKIEQISAQTIDGKKYLLIPLDEDEQISVNGVETTL